MFHKKVLNFISIVLITGVLIAAALYMDEAATYNRFCVSEEKYNSLKIERSPSNEPLISELYFDENSLFFDKVSSRWFYSLVKGSESSKNPKIRFTSSDNSLKIAIKSERITEDLISSGSYISFIVYNKDCFYEYKLACTTLPILSMTYDESLTIGSSVDTYVDIVLFDNAEDLDNRVISSASYTHTRGMTSKNYPKKSYKLSLKKEEIASEGTDVKLINNKLSLLGMRKDDDWILYSLYNDSEKVRNPFASNLWYETCASNNQFNIAAGCEYRYVEVLINGKYAGLYALGYQPDEKQMNLSENELGQNTEYLFKKKSWTRFESAAKYYRMQGYIGYELKSDNNDGLAYSTLYKYYNTLQNTNSSKTIYQIADIDNMIDFRLFTCLTVAIDNITSSEMKNVFVVLKKNGSNYCALYVPWDLDITFGTIWVWSGNNTLSYGATSDYSVGSYMNPIDYLYYLGDDSGYQKLVERYVRLRENEWSNDNLNAMINKYEDDIFGSGAYIREQACWPKGTYEDASLGLDRFRQYVMDRLEYMDGFIYSYYVK